MLALLPNQFSLPSNLRESDGSSGSLNGERSLGGSTLRDQAAQGSEELVNGLAESIGLRDGLTNLGEKSRNLRKIVDCTVD